LRAPPHAEKPRIRKLRSTKLTKLLSGERQIAVSAIAGGPLAKLPAFINAGT